MTEPIGIIGGTGDLGRALAVHLCKKYQIKLGSRDPSKAELAVKEIQQDKVGRIETKRNLIPVANKEAASASNLVFITVPYETALETLKPLSSNFQRDQILVSCAARAKRQGKEFASGLSSSLSKQIQTIVPQCEVATGFQTIPANVLYSEIPISADVLIACNKDETFEEVAKLVSVIEGLRPLYVGSLENSKELESLTALLLNIGAKNGLKSPTFKVHSF